LTDFQDRRGRLLEDAKRKGLIDAAITVMHSHESGRVHAHIIILSRRSLERRHWTPLLNRHGFGVRKGFEIKQIGGPRHAYAEAGYVTRELVGLKTRLERAYGPIARLNAVIIPQSVRRLVGVARRRRTPKRGRWMIFRAIVLDDLSLSDQIRELMLASFALGDDR
jgi:hypothetical protein